MKKADPKLVEQIIGDGHEIANKIKNSKSLSAIKNLAEEIENYKSFANKHFGTKDDFSHEGEKYSELCFYLTMAVNGKSRHLYYNYKNPEMVGNEDAVDFEEYLDSKDWVHDWLEEDTEQ